MNKPKFNLDAHSILLLCNGEQVNSESGKLQLTIIEDVTDEPPVKSLNYEDCFERVKPNWSLNASLNIYGGKNMLPCKNSLPSYHQAKQLAATIKLMTIMVDANNGDWIPKEGEDRTTIEWCEEIKQIFFNPFPSAIFSPIYFRDKETAQRAYEANQEIFHEYFGVGGGE